jgi:dTDP-4-amino-4,6-dideoxygalactose transaminase
VTSRVPFIRPEFPSAAEVADDFETIVDSNHFTNFGPFEQRLRAALEEYVGQDTHATTWANATVALIGAVRLTMGPGDGRLVLVPSFTFAAGPQAIEWCGFAPLFIDVEPGGIQPDIAAARDALECHRDRIAGILFANAFGAGAGAITAWEDLAAQWDLPLVVDSAAGFGSRYADGEILGAAGDVEIFSLHATKPFGIGEGGATLTKDARLAEDLRRFQNFGFNDAKQAAQLGLNGKLQEVSAAIGLRQISSIDRVIAARQAVAATYNARLADLGIWMPPEVLVSSLCFATILMPSMEARDAAHVLLTSRLVDAQHYYSPVHTHPHFSNAFRHGDLVATSDAASRVLSLPAHSGMAGEPLDRTLGAIRDALS